MTPRTVSGVVDSKLQYVFATDPDHSNPYGKGIFETVILPKKFLSARSTYQFF